jgi:hypothetical protein
MKTIDVYLSDSGQSPVDEDFSFDFAASYTELKTNCDDEEDNERSRLKIQVTNEVQSCLLDIQSLKSQFIDVVERQLHTVLFSGQSHPKMVVCTRYFYPK